MSSIASVSLGRAPAALSSSRSKSIVFWAYRRKIIAQGIVLEDDRPAAYRQGPPEKRYVPLAVSEFVYQTSLRLLPRPEGIVKVLLAETTLMPPSGRRAIHAVSMILGVELCLKEAYRPVA